MRMNFYDHRFFEKAPKFFNHKELLYKDSKGEYLTPEEKQEVAKEKIKRLNKKRKK